MKCQFPKCHRRATCSFETANRRIPNYACQEHLIATLNDLALHPVRFYVRYLPTERIPKP